MKDEDRYPLTGPICPHCLTPFAAQALLGSMGIRNLPQVWRQSGKRLHARGASFHVFSTREGDETMKSKDQWRPVTRAFPSPPACLARVMPHGGVVFGVPSEVDMTQHFIAGHEAESFYGGADGWVAHMLLKHVAGDPKLG